MNNKILTAYSIILTIAIGFLFFKTFSSPSKTEKTTTNEKKAMDPTSSGSIAIAYINIDTLLEKYTYAKKYNEQAYAKKNNIDRKYDNLANAWKNEVMQYQQKGSMGTLSAAEIQSTEQALAIKQEKIVKDREKELADLMEEDSKKNKKFTDDISAFIKEYNKDQKYKFIFSYVKNGNMLYADEAADITNEIVTGLNEKNPVTK